MLTIKTPHEKLKKLGTSALTDSELLSILLGHDDTKTSKSLLTQHKNLRELVNLPVQILSQTLPEKEAMRVHALDEIMNRLSTLSLSLSPRLDDSTILKKYFTQQLSGMSEERICCLYLDSQLRLITSEIYISESIESIDFPLRAILKVALNTKTHSIVIAHNHPSGKAIPSNSDICATRRLIDILCTVKVQVTDHIIVAKEGCFSFKEERII